MKKSLFLLCLIISISYSAYAQKLHTPAEIFKIMEASEITYSLDLFEKITPPKNRDNNLNFNDYYQVVEGKSVKSYKYEENEETQSLHKKAELSFIKKDFKEARQMYLKILEIDPNYYTMMTYIGQTYEIERNYNEAMNWFQKSIDNNYIDYMAHWFLADLYFKTGNMDKAIDEITIAKILNRNNPRIEESLKRIYTANKLKVKEWSFNPQYEMEIDDKTVKISAHKVWLGYALVKALWVYEPGYREGMGVEKGEFSTLEEREGILALSSSLDKKNFKKFPELKAMQLAIDNEMIQEYILYEMLLPDHPYAIRQMNQSTIEAMKNYVIKVRGKLN